VYQNTPNPFNPTTTIRFDLAHEGHVELRIYDVAGRVVKTLVNGKMSPGRNLGVGWSGQSDTGARVPSGIYFYQLVTDDITATKKMVLMK
jgi:flagellar hook assembly protein FlgD